MNRNLRIALIISIISHAFLFLPYYNLSFVNKNKCLKQIEVTYLSRAQAYTKEIPKTRIEPKKEIDKVIKEVKIQEPPKQEKIFKEPVGEPEVKPADEDLTKSKNYLDYHQLLRAKIKNYVDYPNALNQGEIHLSFILNFKGELKMIRIKEEVSSLNPSLRIAALDSIKRASPFPPFPPNFKQKEATFNVIISFEINDAL